MADDDQTRKSPVPGGPVPDLAGKRGGGESPIMMMESRIGNLKSPISRFGRKSGVGFPRAARRGFPGLVPRRPPMQTLPLAHANTATRAVHCGHGAPSTMRLPAVRAAGF